MNKVISFFVILVVGFMVGYYTRPQPDVIAKVEYKIDTLFITKPTEVRIDTFFRERLVPTTITRTDTIRDSVWVYLPFERKIYKDSTYRAVVSGYEPVLEAFEIYEKETTIYKEKVAPKTSPYVTGGVNARGDVFFGGGIFFKDKNAVGIEWGERGLQFRYSYKF